jgi:hypothetical protein
MRKKGARLGIFSALGLLAALSVAALPAIASAGTTEPPAVPAVVTLHTGAWHVSGGILNVKTVKTISYSTHNKAKTCIHIASNTTNRVTWKLRLIWYDGGKNKVLWVFTGFGTGTWCSTWKTMPRPNDKVYDAISAGALQSMKGTYKVWTN